jgi:plasmid stability protein
VSEAGIDLVPVWYYHWLMETVTLKLDKQQIQKLRGRAQSAGRSQAAIIRDLIDQHLSGSEPSLHDRAEDLCGSVDAAPDTSTRALRGYGRD